MDPITAIGATAAIVQLVAVLGKSVISVSTLYSAVRDVDSTTQGLRHELDAFKFNLTVLDGELQRGMFLRVVEAAWDLESLKCLLSNTTAMFSRLEAIFQDMSHQRSVLGKLREYYRSRKYDSEIQRLRHCIQASTSCLHIPVIVMNM